MRLPVTFSDESRGDTVTNFGGIESLGPPVGGTMTAQPEPLIKCKNIIKKIKKKASLCMIFMCNDSAEKYLQT